MNRHCRLLILTLSLLAMTLGSLAVGTETGGVATTESRQAVMAREAAQKQQARDTVRDASQNEQEGYKAVLTNARSSYRFGSSRPQRILPVQGVKNSKGSGRQAIRQRQQHRLTNIRHDGRARQESAPFQSAASCDYYIIALRRILR